VTLSLPDFETLVRVLPGLYQADDLDQFPGRALGVLRALISGLSYSYNDVNASAGTVVEAVEPVGIATVEHRRTLERHLTEHPVITHFIATGDGRPHAISDFITRDELHRRAIYAGIYRELGSEDQLSIGVGRAPRFVGICVNRDRWRFSERDRLMLDLLRSHLSTAYRAASERTAARQIIETGGLGVVRVGMDGRSFAADDRARASLADAFDRWSPRSRSLPDEVRAWMQAQRRSFEVDPSAPLLPLVVERRDVRLQIRYVPGTSVTGPSLVIRREARTLSPDVARQLGLTPRESEVVQLLVSGASSKAIADVLVVSQHTVHRHLQNLYAKLGVRSRTAAVARVRTAEATG
jgi:DNA-binding CsgD family transcriptional regulator